VLLIMSILVAAAVPKFVDSLLFHRVETAARRVKADLELAQNTARLTSASQTITFSGTAYTTTAAVKDLDRLSDTYNVDLADAPYDVTTVTADFGGDAFVSFDGYANPSSGGTVLIKIDNDHQCTVTLDATTGHVAITSNHSRARAAEAVGN
jgi:type II secretory pathway pseudopilin PulG